MESKIPKSIPESEELIEDGITKEAWETNFRKGWISNRMSWKKGDSEEQSKEFETKFNSTIVSCLKPKDPPGTALGQRDPYQTPQQAATGDGQLGSPG